ncbi:MAG: phosphoglycerate mutase [Rickettsiales bacterium]|nr:phosphoglycerate mutase [Rickettsiales bacterium]
MKRLYILRHAKAELGDANTQDKERDLAPRGRENAAALGAYLQAEGLIPQKVYSSDAKRTRETLKSLQSGLTDKLDVTYTDSLYLASAGDILRELQDTNPDQDAVMIVGHNPGLHHLSLMLAAEALTEDGIDTLTMKFPTCALAIMQLNIDSWDKIEPGSAVLERFLTRHDIS